MANDLQELVDWCQATKEQQTLEHKKAIRKEQFYDDCAMIRREMQGMQWALDIVVAEIKRRLEING